MRYYILFAFILLMASLRAVSNRETKQTPSKNYSKSCIDRTTPNKIEHNPIKNARLFTDKKTNKLVWILENID